MLKMGKAKQYARSKVIYKDVNGTKTKFISVTVRTNTGTINRQYRWKGGKTEFYEKIAKLPPGMYRIDHKNERVYKRDKQSRGKGTPFVKSSMKAPPIVHRNKIIDMMSVRSEYNRVHTINEFVTPQREKMFLYKIINSSTKSPNDTNRLVENFNKFDVKSKFSYAVDVEGIQEGREEKIVSFTAVALRPREIVQALKEAGLTTGKEVELVETGENSKGYNIRKVLESRGINSDSIHINRGRFIVTAVRVNTKFYNNPNYGLKKYASKD